MESHHMTAWKLSCHSQKTLLLAQDLLPFYLASVCIGVTRAFLLLLLSAGYPLWLLLGAFSRTSAVVGLENGDFDPLGKEHFCSARLGSDVVKNLGCWSWWPNHLPRMTQWIQYKLGKQYLLKKVTLPWESNPGPTPIRGDPATLVASVGLKKRVAIRHYIQVR